MQFIWQLANTLFINTKKGTREMNIQIEIVKENPDGSAKALVHFDKEGLEALVQYAILNILKQAVEENKPKKVKK